ncbi:MAG: energy transducer TonB [Thermoanaerobaculaceae bacterium]
MATPTRTTIPRPARQVSAGVGRALPRFILVVTLSLLNYGCLSRRSIPVNWQPDILFMPVLTGEVRLECLELRDGASVAGWPYAFLAAPPPQFDYPDIAVKARVQGTVELEGLVAPDGSVVSALVIQGLPIMVSEAALRGVHGLRFRSVADGDSSRSRSFRATIRFALH